uniref:DRBM domain-containing protein n=1 Tax=Panagrellus redivivus TaxID=6233 RepID=A0A7E4V517_PANRE
MDEEELEWAISVAFERYDHHKYKDVPEIWTDTPNLQPPPKLTDEVYNASVEAHKNDTPYKQVHCGYNRAGYEMPKETYHKEPETDFWICRLYDGGDIHVGVSRDKKIASHIAATHLLDNAIQSGRSEFFFLPRNKEEALHYVASKREALLKMAEESKNPNPYRLINEYAQFNKINIKATETEKGPPFTSTIEFGDETYVGKSATTKKEARKNTSGIIYDKLVESNKYFEYKQEQEVAKAQKKLKTDKYRVAPSTGGSSDKNEASAESHDKKDVPNASNDNKEGAVKTTDLQPSELKEEAAAETATV